MAKRGLKLSDGAIIFLLIVAIVLAILSIVLTVDFEKVISAGADVNEEEIFSANVGFIIQEWRTIING